MGNIHNKAEQFLLDCIRDGLAHSFDTNTESWVKPYPEVTGYLISYFSQKREIPKKIIEAAEKLISVQHPIGGYSSFFNKHILYTFDTAQIAHGLASLYKKTGNDKYLHAAINAGSFLLSMENNDGSVFPMYDTKHQYKYVEKTTLKGENWGSIFSQIQLKNAEALLLLSQITKDSRYEKAAKLMVPWGVRHTNSRHTHPFGYYLEGMITLGKHSFVDKLLTNHILKREKQGFISYSPQCSYAYVSGSIQLGILLAKTEHFKESKRILDWASKVQKYSPLGGLFQYAKANGTPDESIHLELNSWGTKYYLELATLHKNR